MNTISLHLFISKYQITRLRIDVHQLCLQTIIGLKQLADYRPITDYWFVGVSLFINEFDVLSNELDLCYYVISSLIRTRKATVQDMKKG